MKSLYGDRETVGSIYLDAQKNSTQGLVLMDLNEEILDGLVQDLNEAIESDPFDGRPFYINIVEQRDLQMNKAIKRRIFKTLYRPYPEDNTLCFYVEPRENNLYYCWDLPHHSECYNIISNEHLYDPEYVDMIKQYSRNDLRNFGFIKVSMNSPQVEGYDEKTINAYREAWWNFLKDQRMDEKSLESEKRVGYFWIPNKKFKDKRIDNKPKISLVGVDGIAVN